MPGGKELSPRSLVPRSQIEKIVDALGEAREKADPRQRFVIERTITRYRVILEKSGLVVSDGPPLGSNETAQRESYKQASSREQSSSDVARKRKLLDYLYEAWATGRPVDQVTGEDMEDVKQFIADAHGQLGGESFSTLEGPNLNRPSLAYESQRETAMVIDHQAPYLGKDIEGEEEVRAQTRFGELQLSAQSGEARLPNLPGGRESVELTSIEFRLLYVLALNAGHVVSHSRLVDYGWGYEGGDRSLLKTHISHIRTKLLGQHEEREENEEFIRVKPGWGYMLIGSPVEKVQNVGSIVVFNQKMHDQHDSNKRREGELDVKRRLYFSRKPDKVTLQSIHQFLDDCDEPARREADAVLRDMLTGREYQVLDFSWGLHDGVKQNVNQVAKNLGLTTGEIENAKQSAYRKLKSSGKMQVFANGVF